MIIHHYIKTDNISQTANKQHAKIVLVIIFSIITSVCRCVSNGFRLGLFVHSRVFFGFFLRRFLVVLVAVGRTKIDWGRWVLEVAYRRRLVILTNDVSSLGVMIRDSPGYWLVFNMFWVLGLAIICHATNYSKEWGWSYPSLVHSCHLGNGRAARNADHEQVKICQTWVWILQTFGCFRCPLFRQGWLDFHKTRDIHRWICV